VIDAIPSQVLVHVLTTLGVAGGSTAWGIAYLKEPDGKGVNPQYVTIFDTLPDIQGYNHRDGEPIQHYTVQIRIRSLVASVGHGMGRGILKALNPSLYNNQWIIMDTTPILFHAFIVTQGLIQIGEDKSDRPIFTINGKFALSPQE
jgi:hypothetical protein